MAERLFYDLIWPAAAGNVAWAFFSQLVKSDFSKSDDWAKLAVLLLISLYIFADWNRAQDMDKDLKKTFWIADGPLAAAIVIFAISTANYPAWAEPSLMGIFLVCALGHFGGAWEKNVNNRRVLGVINVLGFVTVIAGGSFWLKFSIWHLPIAVFLVVVLWAMVRWDWIHMDISPSSFWF